MKISNTRYNFPTHPNKKKIKKNIWLLQFLCHIKQIIECIHLFYKWDIEQLKEEKHAREMLQTLEYWMKHLKSTDQTVNRNTRMWEAKIPPSTIKASKISKLGTIPTAQTPYIIAKGHTSNRQSQCRFLNKSTLFTTFPPTWNLVISLCSSLRQEFPVIHQETSQSSQKAIPFISKINPIQI